MYCYSKDGPNCRYCVTGVFTSDDPQTWVHGLPRYDCIHPLEGDVPIDPDGYSSCPESYKICR